MPSVQFNGLLRYFIGHPTIANLLMIGLFLLGLSVIGTTKRETFPEYSPPYITASIIYPGASPIEVEESLCLRMEDAVDGLSDIDEIKCDAFEGRALLEIKLDESKADIGRSLLDVQTQINAINDFPNEIESPIVQELGWAEPVVDIAIAGQTTWPELKAYGEDVKRRLKIDGGVKLVEVSGFSDHQLKVELDEIAIRRLGLSIPEIADVVARQNVKLPLGTLELSDKNLLLRFDERKITPQALAKTIIRATDDGSVVRLEDIAQLSDGFELEEQYSLFNGMPAVILKVQKNKADDVLKIKSQVTEFINAERLVTPQGVTLSLTNDMSSLVNDRLTMMLKNGWQGLILVFLSMWLFFSFRYSFWVAAGLPVSFMGGLFLMSLLGISINVMSLVGLLIAIGILMDDAIVISESIAAHFEDEDDIIDAITKGVAMVAPGVLSSFLTTIFILGSLLRLDGQMGSVLSVVPAVLILVISISLIEAFLILPSHLYHSLNHSAKEYKVLKFKQTFLAKFEQFRTVTLVRAVDYVVARRYRSIGFVIGLFFASIALVAGGFVKFIAFPELDGDVVEARVILPPGSTLAQTREVVDKLIDSAYRAGENSSEQNNEPMPLIQDVTAQYNSNGDAAENGPHVATVRLDLLSAEIRHTLIDDFMHDWQAQSGHFNQALSVSYKQPNIGPQGRDIEVRLQHDNLDILNLASSDLQQYLSSFAGVHSILDDMRPGKEEVVIKLKAAAESYGVDGRAIASQLRGAYFGQTADEIQVGSENIEIDIRMNKLAAGDLNVLSNFPIMINGGNQVPLSAVATLESERSFVRIQRVDSVRTVTVMAEVDFSRTNNNEVLESVRTEFVPELLNKYPDLRVDYEGAAKEMATTRASIMKGFIIGLFGLFTILSIQFRSYQEPIVVMAVIPLALIGVFWGHFLLGYSLSMPSIIGFISLAGIVVNDSILLVQYIRRHLAQGDNIHDSVVNASKERFRAVALTSLTTAAGMLPLMLETSLQAQVVQPLVVSIVFGIFASTMLVLFVVPCIYTILDDFGLTRANDNHIA